MKKFPGLDYCIVRARCYDEAALEIHALPHKYDMMFLEYDLEPGGFSDPSRCVVKTGEDLATLIAYTVTPKKCPDLKIFCHSMNVAGRDLMLGILVKSGFNAVSAPFRSLTLK
ncbi:MAG: hypothetical protein L3J47_00015 [Sulfurovum sp.]|nr:hypothetical protein [Sulfurovum sp.]